MRDHGKRNILGVLVDAVDYDAAVHKIISAAEEGRGFAITALAVHGIMTGVQDRAHHYRLNQFDLVTPDGQPVWWATDLLHRYRCPTGSTAQRSPCASARPPPKRGCPSTSTAAVRTSWTA